MFSTFFFVLSLFHSNLSPIAKLFRELSGSWSGRVGSSNSEDISSLQFFNCSARFTPNPDLLLLTFTNTTSNPSISVSLFLKQKPETNDTLSIFDDVADEFGELTLHIPSENFGFVLRGIAKPKNDQITISLESLHLSIAITDQFSANVTLATFKRNSKSAAITKAAQLGVFLTVVIAIIYGLYKMGDISELVTPAEAAEAELIRRTALAAEKAKQKEKEKQGKSGKKKSE
jgi:hypothetical protein